MSVLVRFAPSPTGRLTFGNLRAPVFNWLYARKLGGKFLLRIDDTDTTRSTKAFDDAIHDDLRWLGVTWDLTARQSERLGRYGEIIGKLKSEGRLYPCYETEEELGLKRKSLLSRGKPPVYDRSALKMTREDIHRHEQEGRKPHWRFLLKDEAVTWNDGIRGPVAISAHDLSDPILIRTDGSLTYILASCVDDIDYGITDIIRGEDHVTNAATQIQIIEALGGSVPRFAHFPHITGKDGDKMSKRLGSFGVQQLQGELGVEPMAVWSLLARLGTSEPVEPQISLETLVEGFDLGKVSRTPPKFDTEELMRLNARILHLTPWSAVQKRLPGADETFWNAVRPNLTRFDEAKDWWHIACESVAGAVTEAAFVAEAAGLLPPEPWGPGTWDEWVSVLKNRTGRKGKELFMPLRLALTGREHGPELKVLLPLIGRSRATERMNGRAA